MGNRQRQPTFPPSPFLSALSPSLLPFFCYGSQTWFLRVSVDTLPRQSQEKPPVSVVLVEHREQGHRECHFMSQGLKTGDSIALFGARGFYTPPPSAVPSESVDSACQAQPKLHSPFGKDRGCSHNCSLTFHLS